MFLGLFLLSGAQKKIIVGEEMWTSAVQLDKEGKKPKLKSANIKSVL